MAKLLGSWLDKASSITTTLDLTYCVNDITIRLPTERESNETKIKN
jgi:hypothetical protein